MPPKKLNGKTHGYIGQHSIKFRAPPKEYITPAWLIDYKIERDTINYHLGRVTKDELIKLSYWNEELLKEL